MEQITNIIKEPFVDLPPGTVINKQLRPLVWLGVGILVARVL